MQAATGGEEMGAAVPLIRRVSGPQHCAVQFIQTLLVPAETQPSPSTPLLSPLLPPSLLSQRGEVSSRRGVGVEELVQSRVRLERLWMEGAGGGQAR